MLVLLSPLSGNLEAKETGPVWRQISGVATETVFLRRGNGSIRIPDGMPTLAAGDLVRTRPFLHTELASMTEFVRAGAGDKLELYPGSVLALGRNALRLDLGRMRLVASGGVGLSVDIRRGVVEMPDGELLLETSPAGDVTLALRRGTGWIKMDDRTIGKLSPGKQYYIPKYGTPEKPVDAGRMWEAPPVFWRMPQPPAPSRPDVPDEDETASETDDLASGTEVPASDTGDLATRTDDLAPVASPTADPASTEGDVPPLATGATQDVTVPSAAHPGAAVVSTPVEQPVSGE
ncbi:MAG TPA: hypothetical protein PLU72_00965 [Candidatus Ozemobacteraceae bacterium]|nr:hypothetical protein [Candidatus Ozemobacteraceae bacterium]HQG29524.1 hypothetical protein [Candidatus Ozemobacteraceae bacterium]